jgi:hypothetical protein
MSSLILLIPDWFTSVALVLSGPFLMLSLVFLGVALGGRREGNAIRCRRCRHEFTRAMPIPAACQECGASTTAQNALVLGVWRPRWRVLAFALAGLAIGPGMLYFGQVLPTLKRDALRDGGIDLAIDAAIAKPQFDSMEQLREALQNDASSGEVAETDGAWKRFAERMEAEPAVRRLAMEYVAHLATWGHMPDQQLAASDAALETFGRALASALRAEPALAELLPDTIGPPEAISQVMVEPILADPAALAAFLRGPVIQIKYLPRGSINDIAVGLVHQGAGCLRRTLAFESATVTYGRRDGTSVAMKSNPRRPNAELELHPDFGTRLDLSQPLADPEWDGTLRIDARVGHGPAERLGGPPARIRSMQGENAGPALEGVFDHAWEVRVEVIEPNSVNMSPAWEPYAAERIVDSLKTQEIAIVALPKGSTDAAAEGASFAFDLEVFGMINQVHVNLAATVEQEDRVWDVANGKDNLLDGFAPGRPFHLVLRGEAPKIAQNPNSSTYLAGRWSAKYDGKRRTPIEVVFTKDPNATELSQQSDDDSRSGRLGAVVPDAAVGPKRPMAETR